MGGMRIAFIVDEFPCLSQTFVLDQITGLINLGHEVEIFATILKKDPVIHPDVEIYELLNRTTYCLEVFKNRPRNKILRIWKAFGLLLKWFLNRPVAIIKALNIFKYGREAASFSLFFKIIPFLDKQPYDIIFCHFGTNGKYGLLMRELSAIEGKLITTFHGHDLTQYLKIKGKTIYNNLFIQGDLFLPISERWKEELVRLGCPKEKIIVHRMGIDAERFEYSNREIRQEDKVRILTVARLVEKKGVRYGIRAVAKVLKQYPNIEYMIAGDGLLRGELTDLIRDHNLDTAITLLGWKDRDQILELMELAHILLAPSVTSKDGDMEGIPVVLMEAMACGLPVISTYHSGIPELVIHGKTGLLVKERDIDALAEQVIYLIKNPLICEELSKEARKYVEQKYEIKRLNKNLEYIYSTLLS